MSSHKTAIEANGFGHNWQYARFVPQGHISTTSGTKTFTKPRHRRRQPEHRYGNLFEIGYQNKPCARISLRLLTGYIVWFSHASLCLPYFRFYSHITFQITLPLLISFFLSFLLRAFVTLSLLYLFSFVSRLYSCISWSRFTVMRPNSLMLILTRIAHDCWSQHLIANRTAGW